MHVFKNIRNNWLNLKNLNKTFIFFDFDDPDIICKASLKHLRDVYKAENASLVKKANKIYHKTVYPNTFERQNVLLADNLFHHFTIAALLLTPSINTKTQQSFSE